MRALRRVPRAFVFALCLGAAITLSATHVRADVVVRGDGSILDAPKLRDLVRLELGEDTDVEHVTVDVSAERANVVIERRAGGSRAAVVELAPKASGDIERTVALIVGELAHEPETSTPAARPALRASVDAPSAVPRTDVAWPPMWARIKPSVRVGGTTRFFLSGGALLVGPFVDASLGVGERVRVGVTGAYCLASASDPLGELSAQVASVGLSAAYRFRIKEGLTFDMGPSIDLGWMRGQGVGLGAQRASGAGIAGAWFFEGRAALAGPVAVAMAVDAGWLAAGLDLRAAERTPLVMSGAFAGLRIGLAITR